MKKILYLAAGALIAGVTFAAPASAGTIAISQNGLTQDLSARCRVVITHRWRHGHRVTIRRTICDRRHHNW